MMTTIMSSGKKVARAGERPISSADDVTVGHIRHDSRPLREVFPPVRLISGGSVTGDGRRRGLRSKLIGFEINAGNRGTFRLRLHLKSE